ncbi:MAG: hypothetical protein ACXVCX_16690 [Ktedonobacterales bacterium]
MPRWLTRAGVWLLIALYIGIWCFSGVQKLNITDFEAFFLPSARIALAGHPLHIYQVRFQDIYPNANGPLSIAPLTLAAALAQALGWLDNMELRRMVAMGIFAVFPLLMAREAVLAADRFLGAGLMGYRRLLAYALFALTPELWHSMLLYGHIEQPIMIWLTLAAVRMLTERRWMLGGMLVGLALLSRSVALLYLLTLALMLLWRGRWGACGRFVGAAVLTVALGLLPFWIADRSDLTYSLLNFRTQLPVSGGSVWGLFIGTPVEAFANRFDSMTVIIAVLASVTLVLALRRDLDVGSRDVYALLAIADLCFPLLIKTIWPYYFLDAYVFVALWWLAQARDTGAIRETDTAARWPYVARWVAASALPLSLIGAAQLAEYGLQFVDGSWPAVWSAADALTIVAIQLTVGVWLVVQGRRRPPRPGGSASQPGEMPSSTTLAYTLSEAPEHGATR